LVADEDFKLVPVEFIANTFRTPLAAIGDFNLSRVLSLQEALAALSSGFYDLAESFSGKLWIYPVAVTVVSLMNTIALVFIIGTKLAWRERSSAKFQYIQSWILLPFFIILVVASVIFCSLFSIVDVVVADFCSGPGDTIGSPDDSVLAILETKAYPTDPAYTSIAHITEGCQGEDALEPLHLLQANFDAISSANGEFQKQFGVYDPADISDAIGITVDEYTSVLGTAADMNSSLASLEASTGEIDDALDCSELNREYTDVAHDRICTAGARAITWTFACLGVVAISGMSIITLRASWRDIVDFVEPTELDKQQHDEYDNASQGSPHHEVVEEMVYDDEPIYDDGADIYDDEPMYGDGRDDGRYYG